MKNTAWIVSALTALLISGCGADNRERIAMTTLYPDDASASHFQKPARPFPALTGALNEKFRPGTDPDDLKRYVAQLNGSCVPGKPGEPLMCSFIESASFCVRTVVSIQAKTDSLNKIGHIDASRLLEGC